MLYLRILTLLTITSFINCAKIKFGATTDTGIWTTKHRISFPFNVGGKHYFFGLTDKTKGGYWFIQELKENGKTGLETSQGTWSKYYTQAFPFAIKDKQFIYGIDNKNYWFIQEILPGGKLGSETDTGTWKSTPNIIFPFNIGEKLYVYSLTGNKWFIIEILHNGKLGSETDSGSWNNYYTLGFPFSINGRQYFYSVSDKYWFIQELLPNGKMGKETDNGKWTTAHSLYVPFSIDGKYYFYGLLGKTSWFIQELLPGGKMGTEKTHGMWVNSYSLSFAYNINGIQLLYSLGEYYWLIMEIIQEPRFPIITTTREEFCKDDRVLRTKRQTNNGTCNLGCGGLNAIEEYTTTIENDLDNYVTMSFSNPADPVTSVSTFRAFADANHESYVDLTVAMRAEIHYSHMSSMRDPTISSEVRSHLRLMDRENHDEAGHLLASSLGGPGVPYNFAPQSPMLNRAVDIAGSVIPQPGWYGVEGLLRNYLTERSGSGYIRWTLAALYSLLPVSRRPTDFLLSVRFYDDQGNFVRVMGESIHTYHFRNVPREACANFNHPWWRHL